MDDFWVIFYAYKSSSCHLERALNVEIGVECQIFVIVSFLIAAKFYNLGFKGL